MDIGNLRDVPANMLSDIVDGETGQAIEADEFLDDLSSVACEVIVSASAGDTPDETESNVNTTNLAPQS